MKHSDVEELARKVGLIEPRDVWADLPADYRQALCIFAALVLEKAAEVANHEDHITVRFPDCGALQGRETQCSIVKEIRRMSAALQSGDRG